MAGCTKCAFMPGTIYDRKARSAVFMTHTAL